MPVMDDIRGRPDLTSGEFTDVEAIAAPARAPSPDSGPLTGSGTIAGRIGQFLLAHRPQLFCDDCIGDRLGLSHRRQANRVTATMGASQAFWRDVAACTACSKHKQVIRHV